jgi:hypothetical protein
MLDNFILLAFVVLVIILLLSLLCLIWLMAFTIHIARDEMDTPKTFTDVIIGWIIVMGFWVIEPIYNLWSKEDK